MAGGCLAGVGKALPRVRSVALGRDALWHGPALRVHVSRNAHARTRGSASQPETLAVSLLYLKVGPRYILGGFGQQISQSHRKLRRT